jgi:hypothetical protein
LINELIGQSPFSGLEARASMGRKIGSWRKKDQWIDRVGLIGAAYDSGDSVSGVLKRTGA